MLFCLLNYEQAFIAILITLLMQQIRLNFNIFDFAFRLLHSNRY